jgi:anti-sigma B factor antagonist
MTQPGLSVEATHEDEVTLLRVIGELDLATASPMSAALSTVSCPPGERLSVDLSRLNFMDATGLRLLIAADHRLRADGKEGLAVRGASGMVLRMFEVSGLTSLLEGEAGPAGSGFPASATPARDLAIACRQAGWSVADLFVAYFGLGGTADFAQLTAHLRGDSDGLDRHQRDVAVHAVNERLIELARGDRLLPYEADQRCSPGTA